MFTSIDVAKLTIDELVERFVGLGIAQQETRDDETPAEYNRLYPIVVETVKELRRRESRRALLPLYNHPNLTVRLNAAKHTYGVDPEAARKVMEAVFATKMPPEYLEAGMSIAALDNGTSMLDRSTDAESAPPPGQTSDR